MNIGKLNTIAQQATTQVEVAKIGLSEDTIKLVQRAKWHHDKVPYTKLRDAICTFRVTYVTFGDNIFIAHGVIWPYKMPDKAANFLFRAVGPAATWNISDIMERCNSNFRQKREVYRTEKYEKPGKVSYPYWTEPVRNVLIDKEFTVKAHHYNGQLQLIFSAYKFQKEINELEMDIQLHQYYK